MARVQQPREVERINDIPTARDLGIAENQSNAQPANKDPLLKGDFVQPFGEITIVDESG
jgi:hypothetical protein